MKQLSLMTLSFISLLNIGSLLSNVTTITSEKQFNSLRQSSPLLVVKVFATWCGPCRASKEPFEQMSEQHPKATFAEIDIDKNKFAHSIAQSLPTLLIFENGKQVFKDEGFNKRSLESEISRRAAANQDDGKKKPELEQSLVDQVVKSEPDTTVKGSACLAGQSYFTNAYNAVRDFFANIGKTITSWFK